ncbi:serine/threonine-protein kinase Tel1p [Monosporozyma unispora]
MKLLYFFILHAIMIALAFYLSFETQKQHFKENKSRHEGDEISYNLGVNFHKKYRYRLMDKSAIVNILGNLNSNRLKQRKDGLNELTTVLKNNPDILNNKILQSVAETLIEALDLEQRKYCDLFLSLNDEVDNSSKIRLSEERLSSIAYVLRLFIEKTNSRFKQKTLNFLLSALPELMVTADTQQLISVIAAHLCISINDLVTSDPFTLKFIESKWIEVIDKQTKFLEKQLDDPQWNNRITTNIITTLCSLVSLDTVGIIEISHLNDVIIKLLKMSSKEDSNTRLILRIINKLIIKRHCSNLKSTLHLINETIRYFIILNDSKNKDVQLEMIIFDYCASELIGTKLHTTDQLESMESSLSKQSLSKLVQEYVLLKLNRYKSKLLVPTSIAFNTTNIKEYNSNEYIQIVGKTDTLKLIELKSLVKLLLTYFNVSSNSESYLFSNKKAKMVDDCSSHLRISADLSHFLINCIDITNSTQIRTLGFQLLFCYVTYHYIDKENGNDMKAKLLNLLENEQRNDWLLYCFIPLIPHKYILFEESEIIKIFKIALPLLKSEHMCKVTCRLLTYLIRYLPQISSENKLLGDIYDIYEYSEINGPNFLCDESVELWLYLQHYGTNISLNSGLDVSKRVTRWLLSKWSNFDAISLDDESLTTFVAWLAGDDINIYFQNRLNSSKGITSQDYISSCLKEWHDQKKARKVLTLTTLDEYNERKYEMVQTIPKIETNDEEIYQLLHNFSNHIQNKTDTYSDDLIKSSVTLLLLYDKVYHMESQHSFIVKAAEILHHVFHSKTLMTQRAFYLIFSNLKSTHFYNVNSILPHLFKYEIFKPVLNIESKTKLYIPEQEIFDDDAFDTSIGRLSNLQNICLKPITVLFVSLEILNWGQSEISFRSLLSFIRDQPLDDFYECFKVLMDWLANVTESGVLSFHTMLSDLTQFLGSTLLSGKFNTASESIKILSTYLGIIQYYRIEEHATLIEDDSCDILDWILLRLDDNSFSGSNALFQTASMLLQILMKNDTIKFDIQGGKKQIFSAFIKSLTILPLPLRCLIFEDIPAYLKSLSSKNQVILVSELEKMFESVNPYFEMLVFRMQMLKDISRDSYPLSVLMILRILDVHQTSDIRSYTVNILTSLSNELGMSNRRDLFNHFRFDILYYFCEQLKYNKGTIEQWNILLFEFEDRSKFINRYQKEIAAILYSMRLEFESCGHILYNDKAKNEKALLKRAYPLIIPLILVDGSKSENVKMQNTLRQKNANLDKTNTLIIVKNLLRFIDFGNTTQTKEAINSCFPGLCYFEDIYNENHVFVRYEFPLNISPIIGFQTFKSYKLEEPSQYRLLIMWIIKELQESKTHLEKIRCLREVKFLILISFNKQFQPLLKEATLQLAPYLVDHEVHGELSPVYLLFFKCLDTFQVFPMDEVLNIFLYLVAYRRTGSKPDTTFLKYLSSANIQQLPCNEVWEMCIQVLKNENAFYDVFGSIKPLLDIHCSVEVLSLFSLLLECQRPQSFSHPQLLTEEQINMIHDTTIPAKYITTEYKLWLSFSVISALNPTERTNIKQTGINKRLLEVSTFPNYTNNIINAILSYYEDHNISKPHTAKFLCSTILCYFISLSNKDTTIHLLSQEQTEKYSSISCMINENTFEFICEEQIEPVNLTTLLNKDYFDPILSNEVWSKNLINAFITLLQMEYPYFKILTILSEQSVSFCESIFIELAGLLIYSNPKDSLTWIPTMLGELTALYDTKEGAQKISLLIQLLLLLRYGHLNGNRQFSTLYEKLDLNAFSEVCTRNGYHNLALLLFEEVNMTATPFKDYTALQNIYEGLDDDNFLLGLPAAKSLSETWSRINYWKADATKAFLFNNAKLDSEYNSHNLELLIKASNKNGYNSISKYLSNTSKSKGDPFEWNIQLSEWKLPIPEKIKSKSTGLYTAIKRISSQSENVNEILLDCLEKAFNNRSGFPTEKEWISLVKELVFFEKLSSNLKKDNNLITIFRGKYGNNNSINVFDNFDSYVVNLDGRYNFIKVLLQRPGIKTVLDNPRLNAILSAVLIENIKLAIVNNSPQYALRNSFVLEKIMKCSEITLDSSLTPYTENTKNYIISDALWNCGEKRAALHMLQTSFEKQIEDVTDLSILENEETMLLTSTDDVRGKLISWLSELKLESHSQIYEKYIHRAQDISVNATYLNVVANFLSTQVHKIMHTHEIEHLTQRNQIDIKEATELKSIYENTKFSKQDRTEAWRRMNRMNLQISRDSDKLKSLENQKETYLLHSIFAFIKILTLTNEFDSDVIDKLCELWFENDKNEKLNRKLSKKMILIPIWKFLPWINQIASKLNYDKSAFQNLLIKVMIELVTEVPYESVYALISVLLYDGGSVKNDNNLNQKVLTAKEVLSKVNKGTDRVFYEKHIGYAIEFSHKSVELAMAKYDNKTKYLTLDSLKIGEFWLKNLPHRKLPLPTLPFKFAGLKDFKVERPYIVKVENVVEISSSGISLPKIMTFLISDGTRHRVLLKGSNDDLRQDAIMEQVFHQVNNILGRDKTLANEQLNIRTYEVVPLGPHAGLIEFVANSIPLHKILIDLHINDPVEFRQARHLMKSVQNKSGDEKLKVYRSITKQIKPQFHKFFFKSFLDPDAWYKSKKKYIKSVATSSIVGHMLGLGDRHLNNLLVDSSTGEVIHIDLGIAFDQGRLLSIPELVPFRLTRDMVDGFGITGVDGLFRENCEKVYSALRTNREKLMCVLNILKWDPLYSWVMSPVRKHKHLLEFDDTDEGLTPVKKHKHLLEFDDTDEGLTPSPAVTPNRRTLSLASKKTNVFNVSVNEDSENKEAQRALKTVEEKLTAYGLSVEATVQELVQQATDEANLAVIFCGWTPFY